ncbi:hypothetical protein [Pantoea ananatis]
MLLHEELLHEVKAAVEKSLTFEVLYQVIRPDISAFVKTTSKLPLKNIDDYERFIRYEIFSSLKAFNSSANKLAGHAIGSLHWLDLCSGDGFRRERALRTIPSGAPNKFLFALALRKLNDWVSQVREVARIVLPEISKRTDPEIIVDVLFTVLPHWHSWGRMGASEKNALLEIISIKDVALLLKQRLITSSSGPVATIFMQAGRTGALDAYLNDIATLSLQPSLRARAYRCQFESKFVWVDGMEWQWVDKVYGVQRRIPVLNKRSFETKRPFVELLKSAAVDRSPMVRRIAGEMLIKEVACLGEEAFTLAEVLAADKSSSVAERGKFALRELEKRVQ